VDRLPDEVGSSVELTEVLLVANNGDVTVGTPTVEGARVVAEVVEQGRDKKILVFKYKSKVRYRRRHGHRQHYTRLAIRDIVGGPSAVEEAKEEAKPKRARRTAKKKPAGAEAPKAEAKPKRAKRPAKVKAAEADAPKAESAGPEAEADVKPKPARRTAKAKAVDAEAPKAEAKPKRTRRATKAEPAEGEAKPRRPKRSAKPKVAAGEAKEESE
jgi:large subunit ribosomal protein L21